MKLNNRRFTWSKYSSRSAKTTSKSLRKLSACSWTSCNWKTSTSKRGSTEFSTAFMTAWKRTHSSGRLPTVSSSWRSSCASVASLLRLSLQAEIKTYFVWLNNLQKRTLCSQLQTSQARVCLKSSILIGQLCLSTWSTWSLNNESIRYLSTQSRDCNDLMRS